MTTAPSTTASIVSRPPPFAGAPLGPARRLGQRLRPSRHLLVALVAQVAFLAWCSGAPARAQPSPPPPLTYDELADLVRRCDSGAPPAGVDCAKLLEPTTDRVGLRTLGEELRRRPARETFDTAGGAAPTRGVAWTNVLTDFFVARLEATAAQLLEERVGKALCGDDGASKLAALLPRTCKLLHGASLAALAGVGQLIRADLRELPLNLPGFLRAQAGASLERSTQALLCVLEAVGRASPRLETQGPRGALAFLAAYQPPDVCASSPSKQVLQALSSAAGLVAASMDDTAGASGGLDPRALRLWLGARASDEVNAGAIASALPALTRALEGLRAAAAAAPSREQVGELLDALAAAVAELVPDSAATTRDELAGALRVAAALWTRRYYQAAVEVTALPRVAELLEDKLGRLGTNLLRYLPLLGQLAEAETSEQARAALEAAAAPQGSYRAFHEETAWFVGGLAGLAGTMGARVPSLSAMLPVGLEFGGPVCGGACSYRVMVSVLDLGTELSARLQELGTDEQGADGAEDASPPRSLRSAVAPGVLVGMSVGKSPLLVTAGAQYLPAGRTVFDCPAETLCTNTRPTSAWRFSLGLSVDLPAFRLW